MLEPIKRLGDELSDWPKSAPEIFADAGDPMTKAATVVGAICGIFSAAVWLGQWGVWFTLSVGLLIACFGLYGSAVHKVRKIRGLSVLVHIANVESKCRWIAALPPSQDLPASIKTVDRMEKEALEAVKGTEHDIDVGFELHCWAPGDPKTIEECKRRLEKLADALGKSRKNEQDRGRPQGFIPHGRRRQTQ